MDLLVKPWDDDCLRRLKGEAEMLAAYIRAMDAVQRGCMIVAGACLVIITLIIPWGVFTRYVLGIGSSWPEPLAVLLMIWFSFLSAAICYRENLHIGISILPNAIFGWRCTALVVLVELLLRSEEGRGGRDSGTC